jgi:hypothetical protein
MRRYSPDGKVRPSSALYERGVESARTYHQRAPAGSRMSLEPPLTGSVIRKVSRETASVRSPRLRASSFIAAGLTSQYAKSHSGSRTSRRTRFTP